MALKNSVIETKYADLVLDADTATFGENHREVMKDKGLKRMQCKNILTCACALLNSGGGIITVKVQNENYDYNIHGIGLDIETGLAELVKGSANTSFFEFRQEGTMLIFVQSWSGGMSNRTETLPQLCTIACNIYKRSISRTIQITPLEVENFFSRRAKPTGSSDSSEEDSDSNIEPRAKKPHFSPKREDFESALRMLHRAEFQYGEILSFTESVHIEFKDFSGDKVLNRIKEALPKYISAFANTGGGLLFIGVNDKSRKVVGCGQDYKDPVSFKELVSRTVKEPDTWDNRSTPSKCDYSLNVFRVMKESEPHSFLLILHMKPFYGVVFADNPDCWKVENGQIKSVKHDEWAGLMLAKDPAMEELCKNFKNELSVTAAPPWCKSVFSIGGADCLDKLRQQLFKVEFSSSSGIDVVPDNLYKELFKEYPALGNLLPQMKPEGSEGVLVFSRSWAVDIGLPKNKDVICDALLVATKSTPVLYTIVRQESDGVVKYSKNTALFIKQKLVNPGGYAGKLGIIPKILWCTIYQSAEDGNTSTCGLDNVQEAGRKLHIQYPHAYSSLKGKDIKALLNALTIVVLNFKSFLSDQLGCEFLNLLTLEQFQILYSKHNIEKCKKLFVHGLPGTGKTVIAGQLIERIINTFHCNPDEVLYICENRPLRTFMSQKTNATCITRKTFMSYNYPEVKHIVVDEAQNFRLEHGDWYSKAEAIRTAKETHPNGPGVFWIFMDYFQMSHTSQIGLPKVQDQDPREELTRGVRNGREIHKFAQLHMGEILKLQSNKEKREFLTKLFQEANCAHSFTGKFDEQEKMTQKEIAKYIGNKIKRYLKKGYTTKQIAILCSTGKACCIYKPLLERAFTTLNLDARFAEANEILNAPFILDSVRRFSGLEKSIIFGIHPVPHRTQSEVTANILVCLASRAMTELHVLYEDSQLNFAQ
ncbi:schlafen family member 11-like [Heterodontus francisci]|uniref:schlafen family member 11-like n=1 Tax=Heterodontus francisci TaxID=7792 RepID=UPI00355AEF5C